MKRSVIQSNPTTLVVSLPKKWVDKRKIKKGDELEIREDEFGQLIVGSNIIPESEITLHFSKEDIEQVDKERKRYPVRTTLINVLRKGYHKIIITYDDPSLLTLINTIAGEIMGYEVIEQSEKACTIKYVAKLVEVNIDTFFIKYQHTLGNLLRILGEAIEGATTEEGATNLAILEKNYNNFCRLIMEDTSTPIAKRIFLHTAIEHLYLCGRNLFYALQVCNKQTKETNLYLEQVLSFIKEVLVFARKKDVTQVPKLSAKKGKLQKAIDNHLEQTKENKVLLQTHMAGRRAWDFVASYIGYMT